MRHLFTLTIALFCWSLHASAQVEAEPNDNTGQANALAVNSTISGTIGGCGATDDWFVINVPNDGVLSFTTVMTNTGGQDAQSAIDLRDGAGNGINFSNAPSNGAGGPNTATQTNYCMAAGTYYVRIVNYYPDGDARCITYGLTCTLQAALYSDDQEPNNNFADADANPVLAANTWTEGHLTFNHGNSNIADYYRIDLADDGELNIFLEAADADVAEQMQWQLFNSAGNVVGNSNVPVGAASVPVASNYSLTCFKAGTYYLAAVGNLGCGVSYRVRYTNTPPVFANDTEPNNSIGQANALAHNTYTQGHLNFGNADDNTDWYAITTPVEGTITLSCIAENAAGGTVRVLLFDGSGNQLTYYDAASGAAHVPDTTTASFDCHGQGNYHLLVSSVNGCGFSYKLKYQCTGAVYANDVEPNNSLAQAFANGALATNTFAEGHISFNYYGDNDDWYFIQTPVEGTLRLTAIAERVPAAAGTLRILIYDASGNQLNYFDAAVGGSSAAATTSQDFDCFGQGTYYLRAVSVNGCGISYRLKYQSIGAVYANDVEPDNSTSDASNNGVLAPNTFTDGHINFTYYSDNDDWYFIQTPAEGTLRLTTVAERVPASDGTLRVIVYDGVGNQLNYYDATAGGSSVAATTSQDFDCFGQGNYYLRVQSINGCGISYRLKYQLIPAIYGNDAEPNNALAQATSLANNTFAEGHINFNYYGDNDDWYFIQPSGDGMLSLTAIAERVPTAAGTLRVLIYDGVGNQLTYFDATAGGSSVATTTTQDFECHAQGNYHLRVVSISGCGISYKLKYQLVPAVFGNDPEPNGSLAQATALNPDSANTNGHLAFNYYPENDDWYRVDLPGTGNIAFNMQAENAAGGTVRVILYDAVGNQLNYSDQPVGSGHIPTTSAIAFNGLNAGTYHLRFNVISGCGVSYSLQCNDTDGDGVCNYFDLCPNGPEPGTACNDNNPCTLGDVIQANCTCAGTVQDSDNDGTCDANDGCPTDPNKIAPGTCGCFNPEPGTACNDGNALTINDVIGADCQCAGTPVSCTVNGDCNDNNPCTSDACSNGACVFTPLPDTDSDGTCDAQDGCPTDPNKVAPGICGCGTADTDTDGDGTANCNDGCPNDPNKTSPGTCGCGNVDHANGEACNDGNACTIGDAYLNCVCVSGAPLVCNDNNPCTSDACVNGQCVFTPLPDSDNDGVCDATDNCPNVAGQIGSSCNDGSGCTLNDVLNASCQCVGTVQDTDGDGICDANDNCPDNPGQIGSPCNDGDPNTTNDVLDANCVCMGTTGGGCTQNLTLTIKLDANPGQTTWRLYNANETAVVLQGGPFAAGQANTTVNVPICVAQGCYHLRVLDSGGNGINGGGYVLKDASGRRIIDASTGVFTSVSEIDNGPNNRAFCVPMTNLAMQAGTSCDKTRPRTSPIYCSTQPGATGYQFWIFDPHGTYNRRVLKTSNTLVPSSLITSPIPCGIELNVRARALVGLTYREFGPACRIMFTGCTGQTAASGQQRVMEEGEEEVVNTAMTLRLFPNPNHDGHLMITFEDMDASEGAIGTIEIHDVTGKLVFIENALGMEALASHAIDLSGRMGNGVYVVSVTVEGRRVMQRLIMD